jgi:hypothetical protein
MGGDVFQGQAPTSGAGTIARIQGWNQNNMRSSKSRSRNKNNRNSNNNRSAINLVNRVFDSSGPEGKVRGTPQQIIDKYTQLARDAQLSNDRVAAENFQQHAEHYLRMLGEAQREIDARRDQELAQQAQRDRQQQNNNQNSNNNSGGQSGGQQHNAPQGSGEQPHAEPQPQPTAQEPEAEAQPQRTRRPRPPRAEQPPRAETAPDDVPNDVIDTSGDDDASGLVDTPESKPTKPRRPRSKPKPKTAESGETKPGTSEAAE